jgi:gamma-glutamylcyclotransferase (GGCT)/AIG2-like uncharacterized protein YtfP
MNEEFPKNIYYFAYGSNMLEKQMKARCGEENYKDFGIGYVEDFELAFTRRSSNWCSMGVADLICKKGIKTYGRIYKINEIARNRLDCCEGFKEKKNKKSKVNAYYREDEILIYAKKPRKEIYACCYFAIPQADFIQPSKKYLNTMIEGGKECGLPLSAIEDIKRIGRYHTL